MMMTNNMKAKHSLAVFGLLCTLNMACTDTWNEHYDTAVADSGTLWQKISDPQGNTQQFARVLEACGYKEVLDGSQTYTVFAPADDTFSAQQADSVIALYNSEKAAGQTDADNKAVKQFVQNHIALYSHPVSSLTNDTLTLMNRKYYPLSSQKLGGCTLTSAARLCNNGLLFTLSGKLNYFPNIFEYLGEDSETDSAYQFFRRYSIYEFDETKSVVGDVIDGRIIYLDSVSTLTNRLFDIYGRINSEDSTYWMAAPTNKAWRQMVEEFEPYFMYNTKVDKYDSLRWSQPRLAIVRGTVFSQTLNPGLAAYPGATSIDSLRSTNAYSYSNRTYAYGTDTIHYYQYGDERHPQNPFQEGGAFYQAEAVQCSNGWLMKCNDWQIDKRETFFHDIVVEAENSQFYYDPTTTNRNMIVTRVLEKNKYYNRISGNRFLQISPKNAAVHNPDIAFYVPDVLSNVPYDVYMVTVPADVTDTLMTEDQLLPSLLQISRCYKDIDGEGLIYDSEEIKANDKRFRDKDHFLGDFDGAKGKGYGYGKDMDTICIAKGLTFPSCSWGLDNPQVQIRLMSNVLTFPPFIDMYDRVLRIDCIIFRPRFDATDEQ